jgi:hypothetical protein
MNYADNNIISAPARYCNKTISTTNKSYRISWRDINIFLQCSCCLYNQKRFQIWLPALDPDSFKLPKAVDENLKKEFDVYRKRQEPHPIMVEYGVDAVPFDDTEKSIDRWRDPRLGGLCFYDKDLNLFLVGCLDEAWINENNELIVVEIKTTCASPGDTIEQNSWYEIYKRQLAFYALLLQKNTSYNVSQIGYFIYCNGLIGSAVDMPFGNSLKFEMTLSTCELNHSWLRKILVDIRNCLDQAAAPASGANCKYCKFGLSFKEVN